MPLGVDWARLIEEKIGDLERDVKSLREWRSYQLGAAFIIGIPLGIFAKQIAGVFVGHPIP